MISKESSDPNAASILKGSELFLIAGPCVVESSDIVFRVAETVSKICKELDIPYIFKASYRKANRSALNSFTGIGDEAALEILAQVRSVYKLPVITDVHSVREAKKAAEYVDILQIPAFLCRQTDLLVAAAKTGKPVCIKKGQFMSPEAMQFAVQKIRESGNENVALIERGTTFGYTDLVVDFRSISIMQQFGVPVIMDGTHALQQPNQPAGVTGGQPQFIEPLTRAAVAVGVDGLFLETHPNPSKAKSDGANMLRLDQVGCLLEQLIRIRRAIDEK